jgi:hypothetical protein
MYFVAFFYGINRLVISLLLFDINFYLALLAGIPDSLGNIEQCSNAILGGMT